MQVRTHDKTILPNSESTVELLLDRDALGPKSAVAAFDFGREEVSLTASWIVRSEFEADPAHLDDIAVAAGDEAEVSIAVSGPKDRVARLTADVVLEPFAENPALSTVRANEVVGRDGVFQIRFEADEHASRQRLRGSVSFSIDGEDEPVCKVPFLLSVVQDTTVTPQRLILFRTRGILQGQVLVESVAGISVNEVGWVGRMPDCKVTIDTEENVTVVNIEMEESEAEGVQAVRILTETETFTLPVTVAS